MQRPADDPVDRQALTECIGRISQLVTDFPAILELDINPLVAKPDGPTAIDVRLTIDPDELTDDATSDAATDTDDAGDAGTEPAEETDR